MRSLVPALLVVTACATRPTLDDDTGGTTTKSSSSSSDTAESSSDSADTADTADSDDWVETGDEAETGTDDGSLMFVPDEELGGLCNISELSVCDEIAQDCPEGEKCVPYHIPDLDCSYPRCMPVLGDQPAGAPCMLGDDMQWDDCDADSWCYPGSLDVEQPQVCISFCLGTWDDPSCEDPTQACVLDRAYYQGPLGCRPSCDPLMPDNCEAFERCTLGVDSQPEFACMIAGDLPEGSACSYHQDCDAGPCVAAELLLDCADDGCCTRWCDLMAPDCPMGLECVPVEVADPNSVVGACHLP